MLDLSDLVLFLVEIAILLVPGYLIGRVAGLPAWPAAAAAPLLAFGVTTLGGPASASLGLRWNALAFLVACALLAAVLIGARRLLPDRLGTGSNPPDATVTVLTRARVADLAIIGGIVAGAVLTVVTALRGMGSLGAVHQDWDAVFHANAIQFILETGNADPSALAAVNDYESSAFYYPNSFHALTAAVGNLTGAGVPELLNSQIALVGAVAGLGLAALLRSFGSRVITAAIAPVLLAAFASFPYDTLWRGPVLPFAIGVALIPAYLLLVEAALSRKSVGTIVLAGVGTCGLIGLQPSTAVTGIVFAVALVAHRVMLSRRRIRGDALVGVLIGVGALLFGIQSIIKASGATVIDIQDWPAVESPGQAVGEVLLLNHGASYPQFWLVALAAVGMLAAKRIRQMWWWLAGTAVFVFLFVLAASYEGNLAAQLTGLWWNDRWRLAGIVVLGIAVLAAHGFTVATDGLHALAGRIGLVRRLGSRPVIAASVLAVVAAFGVLSSGFYSGLNAQRMSNAYGGGPMVTVEEQAAMDELAPLVSPGERVMNDPNDGSAWMYALEDVTPMFGHIVNPFALGLKGDDQQDLLTTFNCLDSDQHIRDLVERYDIAYVYVGAGFIRAEFDRFAGMEDLDEVDSLREVWSDEDNDLAIYRVDLVPQTDQQSRACARSTAARGDAG
ncbi:MAG: DUF6541 family protein [Geodermatophilaceae bacterium]